MSEAEKMMGQTPGKRGRLKKYLLASGAAVLVIAVALIAHFVSFDRFLPAEKIAARQEGELRIHFLDVGQGDCTMIEFPTGNVLVIDAGDGGFASRSHVLRYLKGLGPASVSLLATHADADHYGGFRTLLRAYGADKIYLPAVPSQAQGYLAFLDAVASSGAETETLTRYDTLTDGSGARLVCLSPYSAGETDENDSSTVLYLDYGGVRCMLCGDISSARERRLVREYLLDSAIFGEDVRPEGVEILKAAHHGSADSSSAEWLSLLRPSALLISSGRDNPYDLPAWEPMARYREAVPDGKIYRTDELGDIIVTICGGNYTVTVQE